MMRVEANRYEQRRWPLIVTFWIFSLLFGIGAAAGSGWGVLFLVAWLLLAVLTGAMLERDARRTRSMVEARR